MSVKTKPIPSRKILRVPLHITGVHFIAMILPLSTPTYFSHYLLLILSGLALYTIAGQYGVHCTDE